MLLHGWGDGGGDPADPLCPPSVTAVASGQLQQVMQESLDLRPPPNIKEGEGRGGDSQGWVDKGGHQDWGQEMLMGGDMDGGDTGGQGWR